MFARVCVSVCVGGVLDKSGFRWGEEQFTYGFGRGLGGKCIGVIIKQVISKWAEISVRIKKRNAIFTEISHVGCLLVSGTDNSEAFILRIGKRFDVDVFEADGAI